MQNKVAQNNSVIKTPVFRKIKNRSNDSYLYELYFENHGFTAWLNEKDFFGKEVLEFLPIKKDPEIFIMNGFSIKTIGHIYLKNPIASHYYLQKHKTKKGKKLYLLKPLPFTKPQSEKGKYLKDVLLGNAHFLDWKKPSAENNPAQICQKIVEILGETMTNKTSEETKNPSKQKKENYLKHTPKETVKLLKKFKYDNDSGFKELVHTPKIDNFTIDDYDDIIQKAEITFNRLKNIPSHLYYGIKQLIELMKTEGRKCFEQTGEYPLYNKNCPKVKNASKYSNLHLGNVKNNTITGLIQSFKRNYRFDSEKSEASVLRDLIINVANKLSFTRKDGIIIEYDPKLEKEKNKKTVLLKINFNEKFDFNAVFFTWVPKIKIFLKEILEDILKHGNINGNINYKSYKKEVFFEVKRINDPVTYETRILFIIYDKGSIVKKRKEDFYKKIKERKGHLLGLCDWKIQADFENDDSYEIDVLPETNKPFKKLNKKIGGLKHILTFYE